MQWKRLVPFLLINILVSAGTTLVVMALWDRAHSPERSQNGSPGPTLSIPSLTPTGALVVATAVPTPQLQAYTISDGETLGEIALAFDIDVADLLELNGFTDPDSIGAGTTIFVPVQGASAAEDQVGMAASEGAGDGKPLPEGAQAKVEIVTVIGAGDLKSERVQLRGRGEGVTLSLAGWRLRDQDGFTYTFPQITLYGSGAVNVYSGAGVDTVVALYWNAGQAVWRSGETATLIDQDGYIQAIYLVP